MKLESSSHFLHIFSLKGQLYLANLHCYFFFLPLDSLWLDLTSGGAQGAVVHCSRIPGVRQMFVLKLCTFTCTTSLKYAYAVFMMNIECNYRVVQTSIEALIAVLIPWRKLLDLAAFS